MPTLTASAPASISARGSFGGGHVAGDDLYAKFGQFLDAGHGLEHRPRVAARRIDDDQVAAGCNQSLGAVPAVLADRRRGGDAEAAFESPCQALGCFWAFSMSLTVIRPMR